MTMTDTNVEVATDTTATLTGTDARDLIAAIRAVAVARSTDAVRPTLTGVLIEHTPDDGLRCTATDSYRLAQVAVRCETALPFGAWMIDSDAVTGIAKAASATLARRGVVRSISLTWSGGKLTAVSVNVNGAVSTWETREIGTFPDYRRLIGTLGDGIAEQPVIAWNPRYLADTSKIAHELAIDPKDAATVRLVSLTDTSQPTRFEIHTGAGKASYWLMPVRVS